MARNASRLKLHGFNNLTKSLSFNIYDICYANSEKHRDEYIEYIDDVYNAERLTDILTRVSEIIGATVLNIARQDYEPQGASVTMLIAEKPTASPGAREAHSAPRKESVVAHLDKSHVTVHTYPESSPANGISTFRADIDVSTCGGISPLRALNYLIDSFDSDIVIADYRVRGFTRNVKGVKLYIDHSIHSIQDFVDDKTKRRYSMIDVNVPQENIFHTKMLIKQLDMDDYLFGAGTAEFSEREADDIRKNVRREMHEIFYAHNLD
jgi:S-adenosylmethionine decarboxylase